MNIRKNANNHNKIYITDHNDQYILAIFYSFLKHLKTYTN